MSRPMLIALAVAFCVVGLSIAVLLDSPASTALLALMTFVAAGVAIYYDRDSRRR